MPVTGIHDAMTMIVIALQRSDPECSRGTCAGSEDATGMPAAGIDKLLGFERHLR